VRVFFTHHFDDSGFGPMNVISDASQTLAKLAFSERNPYPGWMASTFVISAALIT